MAVTFSSNPGDPSNLKFVPVQTPQGPAVCERVGFPEGFDTISEPVIELAPTLLGDEQSPFEGNSSFCLMCCWLLHFLVVI